MATVIVTLDDKKVDIKDIVLSDNIINLIKSSIKTSND